MRFALRIQSSVLFIGWLKSFSYKYKTSKNLTKNPNGQSAFCVTVHPSGIDPFKHMIPLHCSIRFYSIYALYILLYKIYQNLAQFCHKSFVVVVPRKKTNKCWNNSTKNAMERKTNGHRKKCRKRARERKKDRERERECEADHVRECDREWNIETESDRKGMKEIDR